MLIYAGIDEAGYGPMFGPLVIARSVFRIEDAAPAEAADRPPDLWEKLRRAVCRETSDKRRRIAVNDSKKLMGKSAGLEHLERGVLSFASMLPCGVTDENRQAIGPDLESLLMVLSPKAEGARTALPWYGHETENPAVPFALGAELLGISTSLLQRAMHEEGVRAADLHAAIVYEDQFNRLVEATRSKGRCAWTFVSRHLDAIWRAHGAHHPWVAVDRQGGRRDYRQLLALQFEGARVSVLDESETCSRYCVADGGRAMMLSFEVSGEENHFPIALASMTAKYVRELLMLRFNAFWARHDKALRPTKGYVQDGRRFLADIEPIIRRLNIDRSLLIRSR